MKNTYHLLCCFLVIFLSGCMYSNHYSKNSALFLKTKSISPAATCKITCQMKKNDCFKLCKDSCGNCQSRSIFSTRKKYSRYVHEQCVKGEVVARELNSYRDPLQCRKVTCNCCADFDTCIQSCNGIIQKRLKPASKCC
ncbi:acyltransferase [Legionella israelensis]|uniref:Acyltransferase n=1 Tax=Legionella israelensis TaxID=454 RepID=A0A0W0W3Q6_9GAMM|nr:acyltransferase [Legionella israelensis]SCX76790.1 hypothetical protein SAMN02746069_00089 [Legionella israelensis DSM 19235]STX58168.1 acyltransferase [Legionella israelensis]